MGVSIQQRHREVAGTHRRCEICRRDIDTRKYLGGRCPRCRERRRKFGHDKTSRRLQRREWDMLLRLVRIQMHTNPPGEEVRAAAARLLDPGPMPGARDMRSTHPPYLWWREATWMRSAEAQRVEAKRRGHYKAAGIIAVLAAVTV